MKPFRLIWLALLLVGCNPYAQYYRPVRTPLVKATVAPMLKVTDDSKTDEAELTHQQYELLGVSTFQTSRSVFSWQALSQAKNVGADLVLTQSAYVRTDYGIKKESQFIGGQTYHTTSYGTMQTPRGPLSYTGFSTTRTSGEYVDSYAPYSAAVFNYRATFWKSSLDEQPVTEPKPKAKK